MPQPLKLASLLIILVSAAWADYVQVSKSAQVHAEPNSSSESVFSANTGMNLHLVQTETTNGYYNIQDPKSGGQGWIYRSLVRRFQGDIPTQNGSTGSVAVGGNFPVNRCKAPYNEAPETGLDIETCGSGGDAKADSGEIVQNPVKNNLCQSGVPQVVTTADIAELQKETDKAGVEYGSSFSGGSGPPKDRSVLSNLPTLSSGVKIGEGDLVTIVGFVADAHYMPKSESKSKKAGETVNCHSSQHESADIHLSIASKPGRISAKDPKKNEKLCQTLSAEMIPHLRPAVWNSDNLDQVTDLERPVRITGQLFFDGSHVPCKDGEPVGTNPRRISVWEVHPIYKFEVCKFDTLQKCDPAKASVWQPLSHADGVQVGESDEE